MIIWREDLLSVCSGISIIYFISIHHGVCVLGNDPTLINVKSATLFRLGFGRRVDSFVDRPLRPRIISNEKKGSK